MEIKTKYNINDKVWIVYENKKEVGVFSDIVKGISVTESGIEMWFKDCLENISEDEIVPYEDKEALIQKIIEVDSRIVSDG